jgi:surface protein
MFSGATVFDQDLSNWNVEAVADMSKMFYQASDFTQEFCWILKFGADTGGIFTGSGGSFNCFKPVDKAELQVAVAAWLANATAAAIFYDGPINSWDTSSITDMSEIFDGASYFDDDISNWNVKAVESMNQMFRGANSFNQDLSDWDTALVTNMTSMFFNASSFNQDLSEWDTAAVTDMSGMFSGASAFQQTLFCWSLKEGADTTDIFTDSGGGSFGCFKPGNKGVLQVAVAAWLADPTAAASNNGPINSWDTSLVDDMSRLFSYSVDGADSFNDDISDWDTPAVTNMDSMFSEAVSFDQDLSNWNVEAVTTMQYMFYYASDFNQELCWSLKEDANTDYIFEGSGGSFGLDCPLEEVRRSHYIL